MRVKLYTACLLYEIKNTLPAYEPVFAYQPVLQQHEPSRLFFLIFTSSISSPPEILNNTCFSPYAQYLHPPSFEHSPA